MRYCEFCGTPLDDDALVCNKCGARLSVHQPVPPRSVDTVPHNVAADVPTKQQKKGEGPEKKEQKSYKIFFLFLLSILLAAGVTIAVLTLGKKTKKVEHEMDDTEEVVSKESVKLHGAVDTYRVHMQLTIEGNKVTGTYYYESQGPEKQLDLRGIYENSQLELFETNENGQQTGRFVGMLKKGIFIGDFYNAHGNSMHFRLEE